MAKRNLGRVIKERLKENGKKSNFPTNGQLKALEEISSYLSNGSAPMPHKKLKNLLTKAGYSVVKRNNHCLIYNPFGDPILGTDNRPIPLSYCHSKLPGKGVYQKLLKAVYNDYEKYC